VIQDLELRAGVSGDLRRAALTRKYVEDDLRRSMPNAVFYGAMTRLPGLSLMEDLIAVNGQRDARLTEGKTVKDIPGPRRWWMKNGPCSRAARRSLPMLPNIPNRPILGACE